MENVVGIRGLGTYLPKSRMSAAEIAELTGMPEAVIIEKFGVYEKPLPDPGDTTSFMGIRAALKALKQADVDPKEIDLVIWNGGQHKDYPNWLAGLKVAHEIGAVNAWSFDMEAMCGSMMVGLDVAKSMMLAKDNLKKVLIVSGYRNLDLIDLREKSTRFMLDLGAGGAALVLEKGYQQNIILGTAFKGDGSLSEDCVIPVLGTKRWPPEKGDLGSLHFKVLNEEGFKAKLAAKTLPNFFKVIRDSLGCSDLEIKDIDYLAILHFKKSAHRAVLKELNLTEDQTTYLDHYGHIGQNDQLLSIEIGVREGKIKDGDNIVMVGAGLGFVWASAVIRWGKNEN